MSATAAPTALPTRQPTATSTPTPAFTPTVSPTPQLDNLTFDVSQQSSPDKSWVAQFEISEPVATGTGEDSRWSRFVIVRLINTARKLEWVPTREWWASGLGEAVPEVLYWSQDGTYVLLAEHAYGDGCPGFGVQSNVRRVDLATGAADLVSERLTGVISVSPDEATIAALGYDRIILHDTASAKETIIAFPIDPAYAPSGNVVWSPGSDAFVFISDHGYCGDPPAISVWRVDLATAKLRRLLKEFQGRFSIREWRPDNQILLSDEDGKQVLVDGETGQVLSPR
jgi:hypothetical protein